jgi:hypothetical protein
LKRDAKQKERALNESSSDDEIVSPRKLTPTKRKTSKVEDDSSDDKDSEDENKSISDWSENIKKNSSGSDVRF